MSPPPSIAHYKITGKLGEGGMGAVYRATDTKLNRDVAIKVIPGTFASDPERVARFTREAHVLASLNHPNIAQIYGVEDNAIVMELVEGATLAERIAAGPIRLEEALVLARQITDALEAATPPRHHQRPLDQKHPGRFRPHHQKHDLAFLIAEQRFPEEGAPGYGWTANWSAGRRAVLSL